MRKPIRLEAFGQPIAMLEGTYVDKEGAGDAMLDELRINVVVKAEISFGFMLQNEFRQVSIARFRKDLNRSGGDHMVFVLEKGPPKGWEWIFHSGKIFARRTK